MNETDDTRQSKKGSTPNQGTLQSYIQNFTLEAIDAIVVILRTTKNENLRMGAAKIIIDKSIADVKAIELSGKNGEPININIVNDYLSSSGWASTAPATSPERPDEVQGAGVAPESKENIDSTGKDSTGSI